MRASSQNVVSQSYSSSSSTARGIGPGRDLRRSMIIQCCILGEDPAMLELSMDVPRYCKIVEIKRVLLQCSVSVLKSPSRCGHQVRSLNL